jgi:hypothetical protein
MIVGRKYWILIWYGILLLGLLGQWASVYWARRTRWQNLDEVLRAFGTILVSVGMLILLYQPAQSLWNTVATVLLVDALICFVTAFILGRRAERDRVALAAAEELAAKERAAAGVADAPVMYPKQPASERTQNAPAQPGVSPDTSPEIARPHRI